jgi:hypothetical protein
VKALNAPLDPPQKPAATTPHAKHPLAGLRGFLTIVPLLVLLLAVLSAFFGPITASIAKARQSAGVQSVHYIGLALYSYANDNSQLYPTGTSSTEVFQKLLDGGYVTDPEIFFIAMPGKVQAVAGAKLKPENVCWDVTTPVDLSLGPKNLPVLFMTGYRVDYRPGGDATPVIKPFPRYWLDDSIESWFAVMFWGDLYRYRPSAGIAVFYDNNSANFRRVDVGDIIPKFVPLDFKPDGKTYRQLTPDGVLR